MDSRRPPTATASRAGPRPGAALAPDFEIRVERPDARLALIELRSPGYREFFFVVTGKASVSITAFHASDEMHEEARVYVFPPPYGWSMDLPDEDLVLQVWEALAQR